MTESVYPYHSSISTIVPIKGGVIKASLLLCKCLGLRGNHLHPLQGISEHLLGTQVHKSVINLKEVLKNDWCNIGPLQKSKGVIAPLAPL